MGDVFAKLSMLRFTSFDMRVAKEAEMMEERDGGNIPFSFLPFFVLKI